MGIQPFYRCVYHILPDNKFSWSAIYTDISHIQTPYARNQSDKTPTGFFYTRLSKIALWPMQSPLFEVWHYPSADKSCSVSL